ncbi:FAD-dependent oxidoreductase [Streptosporangium sp. NBC_01756]|uniref:FAD-dependent oxidoreductase n=1 Tax=Streptosporangium sp. NBC_01756 TaxID=2975950 RepID=UPI002DD8E1BC|nr:FAD-dependent oxidoreductase [Streptosporangium sp. NBC_01756]WSC89548.1 FAD-dependent oxidoreductase [Streptosporangium sp. NBC_01756]
MNGTTQVLIIGAGPTGLTLAVDLARRGVSFRIVERSPEHPAGSRGKGLQPRTQEVFDDLGVIGEILATGRVYPPIRAYAGDRVVWEGRMHEPTEPTADVPYPMVLMQPQWRTERILRDRLAELGHRVELGTEATAFEQDADGVTVTLNGSERVRCAYLVGADGGRGSVRGQLGVTFEGETFETERMLLGDVRTADLGREYWHTWADMDTQTMRVALCPLPGTDVFQFTAPLTGDEAPELSPATFQKIFDEGSGRTDVRFTDVTWMSVYRVNIRMAGRFRVGRVFLTGDAAHVHSPAGGQGLNTGVQDAYNLGWKLAAVLGGAPERLLDTYEEERLPVAADVLGISTALYGRAKRGEQGAHERGEETQQLLLGYRDGALAVGERGGERAPDARLGGGRLFDVLRGPHFTLLALGPAHAGLIEEINAVYGPAIRAHTVVRQGETGDLTDTDGGIHGHYGRGLVLIRPDGYVGYHGDAGGLEDYLVTVAAG